jgi:hypothetical protein
MHSSFTFWQRFFFSSAVSVRVMGTGGTSTVGFVVAMGAVVAVGGDDVVVIVVVVAASSMACKMAPAKRPASINPRTMIPIATASPGPGRGESACVVTPATTAYFENT